MRNEDFRAQRRALMVKNAHGCWSFVPPDLPPRIEASWELMRILSEADRALSELAGVGRNLRNPHLLVSPFSRREAVLSSRIEGTVASAEDLVSFEATGVVPPHASDVKEVANYVGALDLGIKRLGEIPLSLRLIQELHERLMRGVRGQERRPGEFRQIQNHIGAPGSPIQDAIYVPPPPNLMASCLDALEKFLHAPSELPPLIRLALVHYQFEAIHPFTDGNGRVGRLLITLSLIEQGLMPQPLLYLSAFFERYRSEYYRLLLEVSQRGVWHDWINFFLRGIAIQSNDALNRAKRLLHLEQDYTARVQTAPSSARRLLAQLFERPIISASQAQAQLGCTFPTAQAAIGRLAKEGILEEVTGGDWGRLYVARGILSVGIEDEPEQGQLPLRV